jgi:hypothetical protein
VDLLSQAKRLVARKASKLAMVAVPLAVLAVATPAKASAILDPNGTDTCVLGGSGGRTGSCTLVVAGAMGGNTGLNWLQMYGNVSIGAGSEASLLTLSGVTTNGGFLAAGQIPVSWNFTNNGPSTVHWVVDDGVTVAGTFYDFSTSGDASSGQQVTGNGVINVLTGGDLGSGPDSSAYLMDLDFYTGGVGASVTVPSGMTADLNNQSTTPEPASLWLMAGGGALLLLKRRKKQA